MTDKFREYNFEEWLLLSENDKRKIKEKLEDGLWKIKWTHSGTEELRIN